MSPFLLYLLLLQATLTSFSGLASLPMIHRELVVERRVLSERELNTAVAAGRMGPGPVGIYVVSVGYFVAGVPGAVAGTLALVTPAFLILPMLRFLGRRAEHPRVRGVIHAVTIAAAGLIVATTIPLARDAITGPFTALIAAGSLLLLVLTRVDTMWILIGAAGLGCLQAVLGLGLS